MELRKAKLNTYFRYGFEKQEKIGCDSLRLEFQLHGLINSTVVTRSFSHLEAIDGRSLKGNLIS